jgi:TPR repeat protein
MSENKLVLNDEPVNDELLSDELLNDELLNENKSSVAFVEYKKTEFNIYYRLGVNELINGDMIAAFNYFERAYRANNDNVECTYIYTKIQYARLPCINGYYKKSDLATYHKISKIVKKSADDHPTFAPINTFMGVLLMQQHSVEYQHYLKIAASLGCSDAMYFLGTLNIYSTSCSDMDSKYLTWTQLSAENGNLRAQLDLANLYEHKGEYKLAMQYLNMVHATYNDNYYIIEKNYIKVWINFIEKSITDNTLIKRAIS